MVAFADKPLLHFSTTQAWRAFLESDPPDSGVRLKLVKKDTVGEGITWQQALDEALCFGWIDGQAGAAVDGYRVVSFSPRRKNSPWSQINCGHVERLVAEGRMTPAGQAEIDRAKADGRWDAAYRVKDAMPSPEFRAALDASPTASAAFDAMTKQNRFAMIFRLGQLKRAESRTKRIAEYIAMLERGETIY
ncbi:MAG TPA: YdeI/OmpD-associated family protein [Pseudolysinimonas sp.]|nr:YdeI/OmpD-associated family protein [Pseudolysinimonas sp.]